MAKAIVYVAVTAGAAIISGLWYALGKGDGALMPCIASVLAIAIASPIVMRKDFQFVGIPGPFEIFFALCGGVAAILGGVKNPHWFWASVVLLTLPSIRVSLVSLKAYQRPMSLKAPIGVALLALFGLNVYLGIKHSHWLGETSVALVKEWFPEATAPVVRAPEGPKTVKTNTANTPPAPPAPPGVDAPVAVIAGRPLTKAQVEYQRYIDSQIDEKSDRHDAIAALLQAYTSRAILEQKFKAFDPNMLKDETQWLMNRTRDSNLVSKIRRHKTEDLFLDVYVGANGLYKRRLQEIFSQRKQDELKKRTAEVLKEVQAADGVERPGPKLEGVRKEECRYSFKKREFIGKFENENDEQLKPTPADTLAPKLAALKVNQALPEIVWGDMNALIIRRVPDDFNKRPIYETYRVVEDGLYSVWFKKQCSDMVIEIPDVELRKAMVELAKDVNHIIKTK